MAEPLQPLLDTLQAALVPPTTAAASLPSPSDLSFERTLSRVLARNLDSEADRILALAQSVLSWATGPIDLDSDLIRDGSYSEVIDRVETLLERADDGIEQHLGIGKNRGGLGAVGAKSAQEMQEREKMRAKQERLPARLLHDASIDKPQKHFTPRTKLPIPTVNDTSAVGERGMPLWKPILRRKVNPLNDSGSEGWLQTELYEPASKFTAATATTPPSYTRYAHPYATELGALKPPSSLLAPPKKPAPPAKNSFEQTPFEWVGDAKALKRMIGEIRKVGEQGMKDLAIDLEHHDFRSWEGITCLIQLSTRKKDYVIDALNPGVRDDLEGLNEFFTDPNWIKVLHGANSDIVWLQRDFGLYIVGLFDTYHATHILGYAQHSLASLLAMYTDFEPDKRYQLADWRIRPLPKEMLQYARSDTHFLLSIYDHLRLALHSKASSTPSSSDPSPLEDVFHRSRSVSSITFSLAPYDHATGHFDNGWLVPLAKHGQLKAYSTALAVPTLPIKTGWGPGELKLEVLKGVMKWREEAARDEDESARYVLSLQGVLQLAEQATRVREGKDLMQILGGTRGGVSDVVRRRKEELVEAIQNAVEEVTGKKGQEEDVEMSAATEGVELGADIALPAEEPAVRALKGLWDAAAPIASTSAAVLVQTASSSSFFEGSPASGISSVPQGLSAGSSTFFGAVKGKKGKGKGKEIAVKQTAEEREEAVRKVHASLVLGGGLAQSLQPHRIPTAEPAAPSASPPAQAEEDDHPAPLPTEHTYVPLLARLPQPETTSLLASSARSESHVAPKPKDSDVIVVSSLKDKPKKRRRQQSEASTSAAAGDASASTASSAPSGVTSPQPPQAKKKKRSRTQPTPGDAPITPHDYSATPSILDAEPARAAGRERRELDKKQRKKDAKQQALAGAKGFKIDTSEFRRGPRVDNQPKKANVSRSFAK
ncbi:hypothetical protein JCM21900_004740 [Sporobolomyces salmonicolor]